MINDQYPLTTFCHKLFMNFTISESICVLCRVSVNLRQGCFKIKRCSLGIKQFKRTITRITDAPTKPMTFLTILIEVLYGFFFAFFGLSRLKRTTKPKGLEQERSQFD